MTNLLTKEVHTDIGDARLEVKSTPLPVGRFHALLIRWLPRLFNPPVKLEIECYFKPIPVAETVPVNIFRTPLSFNLETGEVTTGETQADPPSSIDWTQLTDAAGRCERGEPYRMALRRVPDLPFAFAGRIPIDTPERARNAWRDLLTFNLEPKAEAIARDRILAKLKKFNIDPDYIEQRSPRESQC
jgi:hypothetical protein